MCVCEEKLRTQNTRDETEFRAESYTEDIKIMLERNGVDSKAKITIQHKR